jgi:diguanylate cyclase (GGDEF)-like protein
VPDRRRNPPPSAEQALAPLVAQLALVDWLACAVVLLYALLGTHGARTVYLGAGTAAYWALCAALRLPPLAARAPPPLRLALATWAMSGFIGYACWHSDGPGSPLQGLYVLPVLLGALVLPVARCALLIGTIALLCAGTLWLHPGATPATPAQLGRLLAMLAPLAVVAWLTAGLGTTVLRARQSAQTLSDGDVLTGLTNRRPFLDAARRALAGPGGQPCSALVLDVEGLRRMNEQYGYEAGNAALRLVAEVLGRLRRETDLAARWGGDEFALLLPGADAAAAQAAAKRIRHAVRAATLEVAGRHLRCAVSVGCASAPRDGRDHEALLASAERRLERERSLRREPAGRAFA